MFSDNERASEPDGDLPPPTAVGVLVRVFVEAYVATAHLKPRERARAFINTATSILADEETVASLFPVRPRSQQAEVSRSRRQAIALYRELRPIFVARLPLD